MNIKRTPEKSIYYKDFPLIDAEFDSFDLEEELDFILHEMQSATFVHKTLNLRE
ncbi:MAG: hypothetical protein Dbin4_01989 [Alphaproteobacteria bacterium]|nr:hypothetical protein [Alphaproteobacteria bacterium]